MRRAHEGSTGSPPVCIPDETGSCGVCADEGLLARVLEILEGEPAARVRLEEGGREGEEAEVALDLLDGVVPGDRIVVHAGFAIALVREAGDDGAAPAAPEPGGRASGGGADPAAAGRGGAA